jgi:hypothetical protein
VNHQFHTRHDYESVQEREKGTKIHDRTDGEYPIVILSCFVERAKCLLTCAVLSTNISRIFS